MRLEQLNAYDSYTNTLPRVTPAVEGGGTGMVKANQENSVETEVTQKVSTSRDLITIHLPERIRKLIEPPAGGNEADKGEYYDVRNISPRDTSELSMDLYIEGVLNWEEHEMLAFQPELHPDYNATIGALTGKEAEPDKPRDIVKEWGEKLSFELRHADQSGKRAEHAQRIHTVLQLIDQPVDMVA
ncbi:MAG: hypothetical protein OQK35_07380 [Alphaproteobacteria bacterium]|nr:hypothetical protein [Rhodospirillales bacterium]MCW9046139.1 hypothetical protein [Alphaproteobacteria bacterium]